MRVRFTGGTGPPGPLGTPGEQGFTGYTGAVGASGDIGPIVRQVDEEALANRVFQVQPGKLVLPDRPATAALADNSALQVRTAFRLRSHRHEYEYDYGSGFPFMARRGFTRTSGAFTVTCTNT